MSWPKVGTLERIMVDALMAHPEGVTVLDLVGTGIDESNIELIAQNIRSGMYDGEDDDELVFDA